MVFLCLGAFAAQVQLGNTVLTGTNTLLVLEFFGGIPYAEPPVGNLRLREPVLRPNLGVPTFDATHFGPACLQSADPTSSEDCLTVNVYRPIDLVRGNNLLPVMVFIHGGGFLAGSSAQYDANPLVLKSISRGTPVIYASLNYRLGPLGFPAGAEAEQKNALNLGLKDQLTALDWIKKNIAALGGDPTKMTVFGESAGAVSIGALLLNSGIENYVRGAILESGGAGTTFTFPASRRQSLWETFVNAIPGCSSSSSSTFDCIRTANSSSLLLQATDTSVAAANEQFPWVPTLDGPNGLIPDLPSQMFARGQFSRIPFISGNNLDEGKTTMNTATVPVLILPCITFSCLR
ncbi:alpha/beta-hydrolase [Marasmius fiardii PR-910]|nr:alpha/beta-hydrolase [Marasmius fiardii PR-910]